LAGELAKKRGGAGQDIKKEEPRKEESVISEREN